MGTGCGRVEEQLAAFGSQSSKHLLCLYDDNILWDSQSLPIRFPWFEPIALALDNALFTVTPVSGCFLTGEWTTLGRASFRQTVSELRHVQLSADAADPYAANLGVLRRQFVNDRASPAHVWLWLIGQVRFPSRARDGTAAQVSFHFGSTDTGQTQAMSTPAVRRAGSGAATTVTGGSRPGRSRWRCFSLKPQRRWSSPLRHCALANVVSRFSIAAFLRITKGFGTSASPAEQRRLRAAGCEQCGEPVRSQLVDRWARRPPGPRPSRWHPRRISP